MSTDDLAPLMIREGTPVERVGQGKLINWDAETFASTVEFRGERFHDLPIRSAVEALTFKSGDSLILKGWDEKGGRGSTQWYIDGRLVIPGSGRAEETIAWMTDALAVALAREVIAETVHSDTVADEETLQEDAGESTSYTDLDTTGPSVTFETQTGRWLVLLVAHAGVSEETAGRMSYEATGAQSVSADDERSSLITDPGTAMGLQGSVIYANTHDGDAGEITVTAKYRVIPPTADPPPSGVASWENRTLIVIAY